MHARCGSPKKKCQIDLPVYAYCRNLTKMIAIFRPSGACEKNKKKTWLQNIFVFLNIFCYETGYTHK